MIRVSIIGVSGLVGECLLRVLVGHPNVKLSLLVSDHAAGKPISDLLPPLRGECDQMTVSATPDEVAKVSDVVFTAKKGSESFALIPPLLKGGAKVIDMGGEFRFKDPAVYEQWYKEPHGAKESLAQAVYGLPEINREQIRGAKLIGNPGCYVTSATLALAPFISAGLIETEGLVIDSYSGMSGAGRQYIQKRPNLFVDIDGNLRAYGLGDHRHTPEIEMGLAMVLGKSEGPKVTFVPHLAPLDRGILSMIFARPKSKMTSESAKQAMKDYYSKGRAPFVRVLDKCEDVAFSNVVRSNYCDIAAQVVERTGMLVIASTLDTLVKGASGQAIQNMNLMFGLDESAGLKGRSL
jgi:N-acetyl-gamma-glutamyl-phosphate reductase